MNFVKSALWKLNFVGGCCFALWTHAACRTTRIVWHRWGFLEFFQQKPFQLTDQTLFRLYLERLNRQIATIKAIRTLLEGKVIARAVWRVKTSESEVRLSQKFGFDDENNALRMFSVRSSDFWFEISNQHFSANNGEHSGGSLSAFWFHQNFSTKNEFG